MGGHANGWPLIERYLKLRGKKQRDLSELLKVTPAAISQFKNQRNLLNPNQLEKISEFLDFDSNTLEDFYSGLFNARMVADETVRQGKVRFESSAGETHVVPEMKLSELADYEPALGSVASFVASRASSRCHCENVRRGVYSLVIDRPLEQLELPEVSRMLLDGVGTPAPNSLVLLLLENGNFRICRFCGRKGDLIRLASPVGSGKQPGMVWNRKNAPGLIRWMNRILEIKISLQSEDLNAAGD